MPFYIAAKCKRNLANASANASLNRICKRAYSPCRNDFRERFALQNAAKVSATMEPP